MSKNPFIGPLQNLSICNKIVEVIKLTKCLGITIELKNGRFMSKNNKKFWSKIQEIIPNERDAIVYPLHHLLSGDFTIYPICHIDLGKLFQ